MELAWEIGRLVGIAFNNPSEFPQQPHKHKEKEEDKELTKEEYLELWRRSIAKYKAK